MNRSWIFFSICCTIQFWQILRRLKGCFWDTVKVKEFTNENNSFTFVEHVCAGRQEGYSAIIGWGTLSFSGDKHTSILCFHFKTNIIPAEVRLCTTLHNKIPTCLPLKTGSCLPTLLWLQKKPNNPKTLVLLLLLFTNSPLALSKTHLCVCICEFEETKMMRHANVSAFCFFLGFFHRGQCCDSCAH